MQRTYDRENRGEHIHQSQEGHRSDRVQAGAGVRISNTRKVRKRRIAKVLRRAIALAVVVFLIGVFAVMCSSGANDEAPPTPQPQAQAQVAQVLDYYGKCRVTAYCSCAQCCGQYAYNRPKDANGQAVVYGAAGVPLTQGVSVASSLPLGTTICIPDLDDVEYIVQDRTAQWIVDKYDGMIVDIYFDSHEACWEWLKSHNTDYFDVYIVEKEE